MDAQGDAAPQIISLDELMARMRPALAGLRFDAVVGVARGGLLPAYLASRLIDCPLEIIYLNLRDDSHRQVRPEPALLKPISFPSEGRRILLCDDVSNSGATLRAAASRLPGAEIRTLVISGNADISLFGPHDRCIAWPWD
jgi:hypoxanthine phosphoribosyltransferase